MVEALNKFDVAERQLNQAIRLFFEGGDSVSIHTLAEAASQILYDLKPHYGTTSMFRDSDWIKDEFRKEWIAYLIKARNFFKHANKDPLAVLEFKEKLNLFSIIDSLSMYTQIKKAWTPESMAFMSWFSLNHPRYLKKDGQFGQKIEEFRRNMMAMPSNDLASWAEFIRAIRAGEALAPGISLAPGLPKGN